MDNFYPLKKVADIYGDPNLKFEIQDLESAGQIPASRKYRSGAIFRKGWPVNLLPKIGEQVGYFKKFEKSTSVCVFTTKGGVLKSTLALNLARTAALHGQRVCVVGLDIQGDVTTSLGYDTESDDSGSLDELIQKLDQTKGLCDYFSGEATLDEVIVQLGMPNLFIIPETPELVALNDSLNNINRREFWLKERVIDPLKEHFDLVIMDCSPNWNKLTTNALVASDALISPLECKINNFRNFRVFSHFLKEFKDEMRLDFESIFVPTKYSTNKKLSNDILNWYYQNVAGCTTVGIKESVSAEEAMALNLSIAEHAAGKAIAKDTVELFKQIHQAISNYHVRKSEQNELPGHQARVFGGLGQANFGNLSNRF
ncbi:ParA family protein [Halobacteriovorax sp. ZH5_bin.2]|uniref:ParA family protein n=1 Tax=unclassified Halobacteriovorax TaxID=2639665 RepID=UPI00371E8DAB